MTMKRIPFGVLVEGGRFVPQSVLKQYEIAGESKQLKSDTFRGKYARKGLVEPPYNPFGLASLSEKNTFHARCCATKAVDTVGQGWELVAISDEADEEERKEIEKFFKSLYPSFEATLLKAAQDFEEVGWACLEIVRYGGIHHGKIKSLEHVPAATIRVHKDENKYAQSWDGVKYRWFKRFGYEKDVHMDTGEELPLGTLPGDLAANELIMIHNYSSRSSYYGVPDYVPAISAIAAEEARKDYNISFFKNFGVPTYAVFITGDFEDEAILDENGQPTGSTILQEAIEQHFKEIVRNPHTPLILAIPGEKDSNIKVEFERLAVETKEASFRLYGLDNRDEIISAHGVDPYRVAVMQIGSLGGNTAKVMRINYKKGIIQHRQRLWEDAINRFVIRDPRGFNSQDWEFRFRNVDIEEDDEDLQNCLKLFEAGAMTPNELIKRFSSRYNIQPSDHPLMNCHYIKGQPVEAPREEEAVNKIIETLETLKSRIEKRLEENP